jgi:hypothetical protein
MKPDTNKEVTQTKKKGNVIINPKKEDLMSESLRKIVRSEVEALRESAKKKSKEKKAKRWWDDDGDGVGYEKGEVGGKFSKKNEEVVAEEPAAPAKVDDSEAKKKAKERMKQRMMQATIDHDRKAKGYK